VKSQALENLVKRLFSDERAKAEFMANPDGVLARHGLTEQEKKAVLTTHARMGLVSGNSAQLSTSVVAGLPWASPAP
jgi:hypothetical protein